MRLLVFADGSVGFEIVNWLLQNYCEDLATIVTAESNEITAAASVAGVRTEVFSSSEALVSRLALERIDLGVLLWWPKIIKEPLLSTPQHGYINTHPSLLPHGRGKNYNFWAIVEQSPFGVSLHKVDAGIDTGDLAAQSEIPYGWEDTGETLYLRAKHEIVELFKRSYPDLRSLNIKFMPQFLDNGSDHRVGEMEVASVIELDRSYSARELLNLLRARTFDGHPACNFVDERGRKFEVRLEIKRK
jgi:methionyl-tRNA formyltransferase